jgi:hypothetical protein
LSSRDGRRRPRPRRSGVGRALPLATWNRALPQGEPFRARVAALCAARGVPLLDESGTLPDADFADHAHLNCRGQEALTPKLAALARTHLVAVGLLPPR